MNFSKHTKITRKTKISKNDPVAFSVGHGMEQISQSVVH